MSEKRLAGKIQQARFLGIRGGNPEVKRVNMSELRTRGMYFL